MSQSAVPYMGGPPRTETEWTEYPNMAGKLPIRAALTLPLQDVSCRYFPKWYSTLPNCKPIPYPKVPRYLQNTNYVVLLISSRAFRAFDHDINNTIISMESSSVFCACHSRMECGRLGIISLIQGFESFRFCPFFRIVFLGVVVLESVTRSPF